jgi:tRNA splicing endonuclease
LIFHRHEQHNDLQLKINGKKFFLLIETAYKNLHTSGWVCKNVLKFHTQIYENLLVPFSIRELQITTTMRYCLPTVRMDVIKKSKKIINAGEGVQGMQINVATYLVKHMEDPQKKKKKNCHVL